MSGADRHCKTPPAVSARLRGRSPKDACQRRPAKGRLR
ncbi:hypothetical protein A33M_0096 [Rhodovulum sp. PH10]|nr:hypothetical protein A33M_0096 [Rhodovulum sp. PH10]